MCGRFAYFGKGFFGYESVQIPAPPSPESYNIAPSHNILVLRASSQSNHYEWA